jgi:hypothetical protein
MKRSPYALAYASWHAHLEGPTPLDVLTPVALARVVQFDCAAWFARLPGVDRTAA